MTKIKLYVSLKTPDKTAITTFHTLERLGYKELKKLEREDYYEFTISGDDDKFMKDIIKVDILVNANKHIASICKAGEEPADDNTINVIVKDSGDNASALLTTLKERMGFDNISEMQKGVLWKMHLDSKKPKELAEKITKDLLYNEHYQEFEIIE